MGTFPPSVGRRSPIAPAFAGQSSAGSLVGRPERDRSHVDVVPSERLTALVTGASAGIGRAFATILAEHGFDLVLTARRDARLRSLATELSAKYGIVADVCVADLSDSMAPARLIAHVRSRGLRIDALINNAGFSLPGAYAASAWQEHDQFMRVLVTGPCELTHLVLPDMLARKRGYIVNVASVEGLRPGGACNTLYAAAKSFMVQFSRSLHAEVASSGVNVTALCPGYTHTEFHDVQGERKWARNVPAFMWMTAEAVARQGYLAVKRNKTVHVPGKLNKSIVLLSRYLPDELALRLKQNQNRAFRRLSSSASRNI